MKMVELRDVAPPLASDRSLRTGEKVWLLNLDQIEAQTGRILSKVYSDTSNVGSSTQPFDNGNVLFSKLRPYLNKVVLPDESGVATTELVPLRPDPKRLDRSYLAYYLRSPSFVAWATNEVAGAKMPRLVMQSFWKQQIPLPPLAEQKRIAAILDKADAIRRKLQQSLRLTDDFLRSVFLDMFGDPVTNPKVWPVVPLSELGSLDRGVSKHRPRNEPSLLGGAYPLIQTGDVANSGGYVRKHSSTYSELGLKQSKIWPKETLCITIAANIANTGILTYDACFPDSVVGFSSHQNSTVEYVQALIGFFRKILDDGASQVAQKNINLGVLRELMVPQPPKEKQNSFTATVAKTNLMIGRTRLLADEAETLFSSLQQRAFRGGL